MNGRKFSIHYLVYDMPGGLHICVSKLTRIGSDYGLKPDRRQGIIWTNAGILLIGPYQNIFQCNLNRNLYFFIKENTFENVVWKWWPLCQSLNVLSARHNQTSDVDNGFSG